VADETILSGPLRAEAGGARELDLVERRLIALADSLVAAVIAEGPIVVGVAKNSWRPPYRQLECDGRVLAIIRLLPKKELLRIEVRGLWRVGGGTRRRVSVAGTPIALAIRDEAEIDEVATYLRETVARTREGLRLGRRVR
jgi:hypothetical protein